MTCPARLTNNRATTRPGRTSDHDRARESTVLMCLLTVGPGAARRRRGAGGGDVRRHLRRQLEEVPRRRLREGDRGHREVRARQLGADHGQAARGRRPGGVRRRVHGQPDRQAGEGGGAAPAARAREDRALERSLRRLARQGRLLGLHDVRGHHHHLQHESREDAADLVGRPLEAGVEGQAGHPRHLGHLGPAVPDGGGAPQRRLGREHRSGLRGDQEAQAQRADDVHAARPDHPALRARRHRARGVVHGPDRRGRPEGRAGGRRLPERGRDRHRADRLRAQGEPEAGARAEVHRHPPLPGGPALLRARRSSPGPPTRRSSSRPTWPSSCPTARSCSACSSPTPISWRRSSRSGRSAGGARSRVDPGGASASRGERAAPALSVRRLRKSFGSVVAVDDVIARRRAGRVPLPPRSLGLRQEHAPAHGGRARRARRRAGDPRGRGHHAAWPCIAAISGWSSSPTRCSRT